MFIVQSLAVLHQILLISQVTFVLKNKDCVREILFILFLLIQKSMYVNTLTNRKKLKERILLERDSKQPNGCFSSRWTLLGSLSLILFLLPFFYWVISEMVTTFWYLISNMILNMILKVWQSTYVRMYARTDTSNYLNR